MVAGEEDAGLESNGELRSTFEGVETLGDGDCGD